MNTESHQAKNRLLQLLSFGLPFLVFGAIGWICEAMSFRGNTPVDYSSCSFYFVLFGGCTGVIGYLAYCYSGRLLHWRHKPHDQSN